MARLTGKSGKAYGIEYVEPVYEHSIKNLQKDPFHKKLLENKTIELKSGDGWEGWSDKAPFNAIHVGAAAETIPKNLVQQLASPGRLVIPVGDYGSQVLLQIDKDKFGNVMEPKPILGVRYVPLVNPNKIK
jgi:protein-L-isoaspartate(D-aspartate) O-methyltransferase